MRKWWKRAGIVAGGLLGLGQLLAPAQAQFPGMGGPALRPVSGVFANDAPPPVAPDFPNEAPCPPGAADEKASPFSLKENGMPNAFNDVDCCQLPTRRFCFVARGEYLNWHVQNGRLNSTLLTTVDPTTTPSIFTNRGALGDIGTRTLLGPGDYDYGRMNGGRVTLGFAPGIVPPVELTGFWLQQNLTLFNGTSNGAADAPVISRPVQLADQTGTFGFPNQDVYFVAFPSLLSGGANVTSRLSLWGFESNFLVPLGETDCLLMYFIAGYRHANLTEDLTISTFSSPIAPALTNFLGDPNGFGEGTTTSIFDRFRVRNRFDGGQIGLRSILTAYGFSLFVDAKLAMGNTNELLDIAGNSTLQFGTNTITAPGGVLTGPSNIGQTSVNTFSIISEGTATLGYQIHPNIRLFGGYNVFYWNRVARAGQQISTLVDTRQVPTDQNFVNGLTGIAPTRQLNDGGFFAHGWSVGVEIGF
jgi:hypothetical protein